VSDEAYADVQDMLDQHPGGLVLGVDATVQYPYEARPEPHVVVIS
jgi:hypothetical protein